MSRRMTIIGLAALCALALSAISASGASAGTTAFRCVSGSGFTNSDCELGSSGSSGHVSIATHTTTALSFNSLTTSNLTAKLFGATVQLQAIVGMSCAACSGENKEVGAVMEFTGTAKLQFSLVQVVGFEGRCSVPGITTKPLKFTTTSVAGVTLEPVTGTLLAEFDITGSECPVAAEHLKITGKAFGAANGAKLTFNVTKASEELKLEGEKASLTASATISGTLPFGDPVALTTA